MNINNYKYSTHEITEDEYELNEYAHEEAEMKREKKLGWLAKYMALTISKTYFLDWTLLENILNDNKDLYEKYGYFEKHLKYINRRSEKSAYLAVITIGDYFKIANYQLLNDETTYQDIITGYRFFGKKTLIKGIEYLLRTLVSIRNKINDQQHQMYLDEYIKTERSKLSMISEQIPSGFEIKTTKDSLSKVNILPDDQRKNICPSCSSSFLTIPDSTQRCTNCKSFMYVRTRVTGERVIVSKREAEKIKEEWSLIEKMSYVEQ